MSSDDQRIRARKLNPPDVFAALVPLIEALERLNLKYHVGGSIASSLHGVSRGTADADIAVNLSPEAVAPLVEQIERDYYVDGDQAREAARRHASFNVLHLDTFVKVDIFVVGRAPFERQELDRARPQLVEVPDGRREVFVKSPEDVILRKLDWYRAGNEVSERQWSDVLGVLKMQGDDLDFEYMSRWAADLGVAALLDRAIQAARV